MLQQGGSKQYIGDLTPEITSPHILSEKCDFFYVSGHGQTNLDGWMIVPENTFIVFIAFSGFITKVAHKAEWLIHGETPSSYFKGMYDTYFQKEGSNSKTRPYADQHVYIPGDILPITTINFKSGTQDRWDKGVFKCPVKDPKVFDIDAPENNLVYVLGEFSREGLYTDRLELSKPKQPEWGTFVALSKEDKLKFLEENPQKKNVKEWFIKPFNIPFIVDTVFKTNPDSIWNRLNPYQDGVTLPYLVTKYVPTKKHYKFIIVNSCRPPTNLLISDPGHWFNRNNLKTIISAKDPRNLPNAINTRRRFARRASFSAKPSEEICATTDDPPMNLSKVLGDLEKVISFMPIGIKEDEYINDLQKMFYPDTTEKSLTTWLKIEDISELLLNRVFYPYTILISDTTENTLKRVAFTLLIDSIKMALGAFMVGVHFDSKTDEKRAHLLGRQLLEQAGYADRERPLNEKNQRAILASQRVFIEDPKWTALRQPRSPSTKKAQENAYAQIQANENTKFEIKRRQNVLKFLERYDKDKENITKKFETLYAEVKALYDYNLVHEYFNYLSVQRRIRFIGVSELKDNLASIQPYIDKLETSLRTAREHYEEFYTLYPTEPPGMMNFFKGQLDKIEEYIKNLKQIKKEIQEKIESSIQAPKPVVKTQNSKGPTRKNSVPSKPLWNEKELLKWRVEWLAGERNPRRDEVRIKQWSSYRSGLTAPQRQAQNRNLTRRVSEKKGLR